MNKSLTWKINPATPKEVEIIDKKIDGFILIWRPLQIIRDLKKETTNESI